MGDDEREIGGMRQLLFDFTPDEDLEQRRRLIRAQQKTLRDVATRLDEITSDHKNRQEYDDGME